MADWTLADLDQYGSYATPHFAHSQLYSVRNMSRARCELFCARGWDAPAQVSRLWFRMARRCCERAERAESALRAWRCAVCAICPGMNGCSDTAARPPAGFFLEPPVSAMDIGQRVAANREQWEQRARRQVQELYYDRFGMPPAHRRVQQPEAIRRLDPAVYEALARGRDTQAARRAEVATRRTQEAQ